MKKIISFILCIVMCISVMSLNMLTASAAGKATNVFDVNNSGMQNSEISFVINLKPNVTRFSGAVLNVEFDSSVLELKSATPVYTLDEDGNSKYNIFGEYVSGFVSGSKNVYSVAFMSNTGATTGNSEYKSFFKITFKVITSERPSTTVKFNCKEVFTNDDVDNDIRPADGPQTFKEFTFSTLDNPKPLSTTLLENGILFKWSNVEGAEEYSILRKASNEGIWRTIKEVTEEETSYVDTEVTSGVTYTYSVKCGNGYGDSGYYATGVSQLYLKSAAITSITNVNNTVRVMWSAVPGAESYAVYRQSNNSNEWKLLEKTASSKLYYEDTTVVSNNSYNYCVAVESGNVSTIVGVNSKKHKFLGAPVISECKNTEDGITLSWNAVIGASSYEIYRKNNANEEWKLLTTTTSTNYLDKNVANGTSYFYALKTIGVDANSSLNTAVSIARISAPKINSLECVADGVNISWQQVNEATGYNIYRKARGENEWENAGSVGANATSFKDSTVEGGYYTYGITATVNKSESLLATIDKEIYFLRSPKNVVLKNVMNGIEISWDSTKNASKYIIMRKESKSGEVVSIGESKATKFIDEKAVNLSSYSYLVVAVDSNGVKSVGSQYTLEFFRVAPPKVTNAVAQTNSITVTWDAMTGVDSYNIYRTTDGNWAKIGTAKSNETKFEDTAVSSGVQYRYTVTAVKNNTESYIGDENSKIASYVNKPSALNASLTATGITLEWKITDELSKFEVYKRVKGQTEWTTLTKTNSSVTTVHDTDVKSGTTYEYAIKAISNDGSYTSSLSDIKEVIYLSPIETVKVGAVAGGVKITWSKVSGAENYIVYRRLEKGTWETIATVKSDVTKYTDTKAESNKTYYYTVRAEANGYRNTYQNYKIYYLAAPKITKFDSQVGKGITIKWANVHGASTYYVYRKTGDSGWKKIATTENLLYLDKNVKLGTTYIYTVRANGNGVTSPYYSGWKRQFTPGTPNATSLKASGNSITLKWGTIAGADGYRVYRKAGDAKKWSQIATVKGTSYTDKNIKANVKYTYTIRAYKGKVLSEYNKTGWTGAILSTPKVKVANASKGVKVTWSTNGIANGYTVYRSIYDPVNKKWSSWKNMGTAKATKSSWVDKSVQSGTTYRYTVRTVCGNIKSPYKASNTVLYLKEPTVKISNATNGITVKWTQALQAKGYTVYRSELNETTGKWSKWQTMGTAKSSKSSWTDKSVVSGVTYKYTVRSVNGKALSSYTSTGALKFLSTPQLLSAIKTADGIVVTYQQVTGADGYRIYRKTADTSWVQIAEVEGKGTVNYTDKTVDEKTEYIYTVRAISGKSISYYNKKGVTCK